MKIIRFLDSGEVVVCSDTSRANRGEVYVFPVSGVYEVTPCVYFHVCQNSRTLPQGAALERCVDAYGYVLHIENQSYANNLEAMARVYSADRSIIASGSALLPDGGIEVLGAYELVVEAGGVRYDLALRGWEKLAHRVAELRSWLTLNAGDWLLFPLCFSSIKMPRVVSIFSRISFYEENRLVLDELFRS